MENTGTSAKPLSPTPPGSLRVPIFLLRTEPWPRVFFSNLRDLLFPRRHPPLELTSAPADFWPDVLVSDRFPWRGVRDSVLVHLLVVSAVYAMASYGFFARRPQEVRNPFRNTIAYYSIDDYLPELNSGSKPAKFELKGEPAYAKQEIISVPPQPDNTRQTIVTPWEVRVKTEIKLPNIVSWDPTLPAVPMSAIPERAVRAPLQPQVVPPPPEPVTRAGSIRMPSELMRVTPVAPAVEPVAAPRRTIATDQQVVPPSADPALRAPRSLADLPRQVVPPAPEIDLGRRSLPTLTAPSVVEPVVEIGQLQRRPGALNIAAAAPQVAAPSLPMPEQRALGVGVPPKGNSGGGGPAGTSQSHAAAGASTAAAPAQTGGGAGSQRPSGQLMALSVDPAEPMGPIEVPTGTRRGIFAATPEGKPGAPGTPDIHSGGTGTGGTSNTDGPGSGAGKRNAPEGVFVGPGTQHPQQGPVATKKLVPEQSANERLAASVRTPDIPRPSVTPPADKAERQIVDKVFGSKKYYSLTLNMPNLSSSSGSWVIRFAELRQTRNTAGVSGPVPLKKVDPAYPADLLRDKVEGTVTLYAVIHADGSVSDIRVLDGVDEHLDQSAMKALARWQFRPGTKNGEPIDLEAVVHIPFRARRSIF